MSISAYSRSMTAGLSFGVCRSVENPLFIISRCSGSPRSEHHPQALCFGSAAKAHFEKPIVYFLTRGLGGRGAGWSRNALNGSVLAVAVGNKMKPQNTQKQRTKTNRQKKTFSYHSYCERRNKKRNGVVLNYNQYPNRKDTYFLRSFQIPRV